MICSLSPSALTAYVARQISLFFPDREVAPNKLEGGIKRGLDRLETNLAGQNRKYGRIGGEVEFNHLHTDQYATFLYYVSNSMYRDADDPTLTAKIYALNKALHSVDIFFEVELPEVFVLQHPVGTVLGRAAYGNFLFVYQHCLVGMDVDGSIPVLGEGVVLFGGSSVVGRSNVGSNVWISTGSLVLNTDVPDNSTVFGRSPDNIFRPARDSVRKVLFHS